MGLVGCDACCVEEVEEDEGGMPSPGWKCLQAAMLRQIHSLSLPQLPMDKKKAQHPSQRPRLSVWNCSQQQHYAESRRTL